MARRGRASAEARIRWRLGTQARQSGGWLRCGRNVVARRGARFLSPAGPLTSLAPLHPKDPAAGLQIQSGTHRQADKDSKLQAAESLPPPPLFIDLIILLLFLADSLVPFLADSLDSICFMVSSSSCSTCCSI